MEHDPDTDGPISIGDLARAARAEVSGDVASHEDGGAARFSERVGDTIDRYVLVRRLGEGGMGTVWEAEQTEPVRRRVALKVIRVGMDTERVVARFAAERQALALMKHAHIAAVLDAGSTGGGSGDAGRPYFVMELVDGVAITGYCEEHALDISSRLRLFLQVCSALQHAHQKGIVHRDIKPSNVLVTSADGHPLVKVIDFGIAKVTDADRPLDAQLTEQREVIGTLEYMSPEQASGTSVDVDTRADVYSLGVLLYELLTGERPFEFADAQQQTLDQLLRTIREEAPRRPSLRVDTTRRMTGVTIRRGIDPRRLRRDLRGELDWITLKALEKDRDRRYASAAGLAADVQRFLEGEMVEARPPSRVYRLRKFVGRNRGPVVAAVGMFILLVAGMLGTGYGLWRSIEANEETARQVKRATEANRVLSNMLTGVAPRLARGKDTELLIGVLDDTSRRLRAGEVADPIVAAGLDLDIGGGYFALGRFTDALVHMERAAELRAGALGADAPETLYALRRRADALRMMERVLESETAYRDLLEVQQRVLGGEDAETLASMRGLGSVLHRLGRVDEAHVLLSGAVGIERRVLSDERRAASSALADLATLEFFGRHDAARAKVLFAEALDLARAHMEPDHPRTLRYLETLSQVEADLGNVETSLEMCDELSARYARIYGAEHRETLASEANRAFTLSFAGRAEEAETLMRSVLAIQRRVHGADDPDTLWTLMQVALFDAAAGRFPAAVEALQETIDRSEALGVPAFEQRRGLGAVYRDMGDNQASCAVLEETYRTALATMGPTNPGARAIARDLALSLELSGDSQRTVPGILAALAALEFDSERAAAATALLEEAIRLLDENGGREQRRRLEGLLSEYRARSAAD